MDIEQIQKINALAVDLMKRGLANDREEAVRQAEKVYHGRDIDGGYSSMRQTMEGVNSEVRRYNIENNNVPAETAGVAPEISQDQLKGILEKNTTFIITKFKEFQEKIESMEKEMATLRNQMTYSRVSAPAQSSSPGEVRIQSASPERTVSVPASAQGSSSAPASHPRSGGYNVGDVSIEKFFYAGHK
ncbi:hypothetical protein HYX11_04405 [Candidatus Woesearchaeota archaeon]|nr:hypothetical protein [Candidatus Woesearchaeota archaeon]